VAVQAAGCAPVVRAFTQGDAEATRWEGAHTIASGLRVPAAVGDRLMLAALRDSGGTAVAIADPTLIADMVTLAALEGINAAPEAGACVAAVRELLARGTIAPSDEVVIFNTGAGTKYLEALRELPSATPRPA
jgi:threonine synthase